MPVPPKKQPTLWPAAPHTVAKIAILEGYLRAWFPILGRTAHRGQDLLYIDGFAGPGQYTNHPTGSPIAALRAACNALAGAGDQWKAGDIHCAFFENHPDRFAHLNEHLDPFRDISRLHVHTYETSFIEGVERLQRMMPSSFRGSSPLFVFIDPFGATGAPFSVVADILDSPRSEVLINFDVDAIGRILRAGEHANHERLLEEIFGDYSWQAASFLDNGSFLGLCRELLNLYKTRLRSLPGVHYAFSFEMKNATNSLEYNLVFASQHPRGLERMKEAMKRIDQSGSFHFSDAHVNHQSLFRFDEPQDFAPRLHHHFAGRELAYSDLTQFTLNETPFVNPKGMLKWLEQHGRIEVISSNPKRRIGTFNEKTLVSIRFSEEDTNGEAEQHRVD